MSELSIADVLREDERLTKAAKEIWIQLATELEALIPESLQLFAAEHGWTKDVNAPADDWTLPKFLMTLASNTKNGGFNDQRCYKHELTSYGFKNFDDPIAKFCELEKAWRDLIRIEITLKGDVMTIYFFATEFRPQRST